VITSRPNFIRDKTCAWVEKYFPGTFEDIVLTDQYSASRNRVLKSEICSERGIELIIEDSLDHAVDCARAGIKSLLIDCPWNNYSPDIPIEIRKVNSWEEIVNLLG